MERNEAIEVIKRNYPHVTESGSQFETALRLLIPELKESEDERIRKRIIHALHGDVLEMSEIKEAVAWLEKQGEKGTNGNEREIPFSEQKTADKVEPKFRAGVWVVLTAGELSTTLQIVKVDTNKKLYWFNDNSYLPIVDEGCLRLWTIQDAKDGDVLVCPLPKGYNGGVQIFIFKSINSRDYVDDCIEYYCRVCEGVFYENENGPGYMGTTTSPLHPATKEQCDLLFAKMKEAGYEWNAEKKELKKIKQSPIDVRTTGYWYVEDVEQKPAVWSEEDENILNDCIKCVMVGSKSSAQNQGIINWLKLLKDRVQPQQGWSEEDKAHIDSLLKRLEGMCKPGATFTSTGFAISEDEDWLKYLIPQSTWKPSEEQMELLREVQQALLGKDCHNRFVNFMYELKRLSEE